MDFLTVQMEIPVAVTLRVTNNNYYWLDNPDNRLIYLAVNHKQGICQPYITEVDVNGNRYIMNSGCHFAFRETNNGIQFYDNGWRYFEKMTQELWVGYKAEDAILGDD